MSEQDPTQEVQRLFVANIATVKHYVLSLLPNPSEADDIVQEVFMTVTAKASDFQAGTNFKAWVLTIARFKVMEYLRREKRDHKRLSDVAMELLAEETEVKSENQAAIVQALNSCLEKLAPRNRSMIKMLYEDEMKPGEIAREIEWEVNGVYVALSRARSQLRSCVNKQLQKA